MCPRSYSHGSLLPRCADAECSHMSVYVCIYVPSSATRSSQLLSPVRTGGSSRTAMMGGYHAQEQQVACRSIHLHHGFMEGGLRVSHGMQLARSSSQFLPVPASSNPMHFLPRRHHARHALCSLCRGSLLLPDTGVSEAASDEPLAGQVMR